MPSRRELANAIRALSMDAVQQANSGHPGMPMGMADIAEVLWNDFLRHNPLNPHWVNRDRFVLSNGHGCMLLYSLLHLTGYALSLDEIKRFRQLHSLTPGHPEYGETPGVETTTGPLGQGLANAVGMALAEKVLAAQFNQPDHEIIDHYTYVFAGDGCLMEGISHEVCSLAGTLALGKLVLFYDHNGVSIDGQVGGWFTDDTPKRFEAYGWHVVDEIDGHDHEDIMRAIQAAQQETERPTLICCKTEIGYGAPNLAGSHQTHGAPLGADEVLATRENIGWPHAPFEIPEAVYLAWNAQAQGEKRESAWQEKFTAYAQAFPNESEALLRRLNHKLPIAWKQHSEQFIRACQSAGNDLATRKASKQCLDSYGPLLSELLGGSADLSGSNCTFWQDSQAIRRHEVNGNYIHYGVREFGMFAIMNGLALHGGFIPYGGTFLTFVDYGRNAVRLASMMRQKVIFVLTHDSIGLGEDGPTHQPIEHASMLRLTPGLMLWRPADAVETAVAWQQAIEHQGPSCLLLTRQTVPHLARSEATLAQVKRGGYIIQTTDEDPEAIIMATGSELHLAIQAAESLANEGCQVRVVSMPSTTLFDQQDLAYRESVLPAGVRVRVAVEAGVGDFWHKYVGLDGRVVGLNRFGASAPYQEVYREVGITSEAIIQAVKEQLAELASLAG